MAGIATPIPELKLNDGTVIPMLGYGTGTARKTKDSHDKIDRETVEAIKTALKLGYYHIDAAESYTTETEVGVAIKESKIEREKLFVTTKVLASIADIPKALDASLKRLQLEYVDLYLIHSPYFTSSEAELQEAWRGMESVKTSGKARSIGVSNFLERHLRTILSTASTPPSINQIEYHPYLQHSPPLLLFHESVGIATSAYGPLTAVTRAKPGPCDELLAFLAQKYFVSESEIALRWVIDQGVVAITTSGKEQRLSDYLRAMTFRLTPKEVKDLAEAGLGKHHRAFLTGKFDQNDRS